MKVAKQSGTLFTTGTLPKSFAFGYLTSSVPGKVRLECESFPGEGPQLEGKLHRGKLFKRTGRVPAAQPSKQEILGRNPLVGFHVTLYLL